MGEPSGLFIPQWAEAQMRKKEEAARIAANDAAELELLRSFYVAWTALHSVPKDEKPAAAETLVRISHAIKARG